MGILSRDPQHLMTIEATSNNWGEASATHWLPYTRGVRNPNGWITLGTIYPRGRPLRPSRWRSIKLFPRMRRKDRLTRSPPTSAWKILMRRSPMQLPYNSQQLRQEGYTEVLAGAYLGRLFGSGAIWPFNSTCCEAAGYKWQTDLDATPSFDQQRLGQLFRSREHWKLEPDINHTAVRDGYGSGATLTATSRTRDGQTIIAYIPNGNATTLAVDLSRITSAGNQAVCWWLNPSSGAASRVGTYANSGTRNFTPPDSNDWVLVIDDASANLPAPGSHDLVNSSR